MGSLRPSRPGRRAVAALLLPLLAACGDDDDARGATPAETTAQSSEIPWGMDLVSTGAVVDGEADGLVVGTVVRLTFHEDGRVIAAAGCNTIGIDDVSVQDGTLFSMAGSMTEMGCPPERHAQDEWLSDLLSTEPSWSWDGETLVLARDDDELTMVDREVADIDRPLEGTWWILDTVIEGELAASVPAGAPAHLRFGVDLVSGSTGCNELDGEAEVVEDTVVIGEITLTDEECSAEREAVQDAVVGMLDDSLEWEIEADRLTLTAEDGDQLVFTAGEARPVE